MVPLCLFCLIVHLRKDNYFAERKTTHYTVNCYHSFFTFVFKNVQQMNLCLWVLKKGICKENVIWLWKRLTVDTQVQSWSPGLKRGTIISAAGKQENFPPQCFTSCCSRPHMGGSLLTTHTPLSLMTGFKCQLDRAEMSTELVKKYSWKCLRKYLQKRSAFE